MFAAAADDRSMTGRICIAAALIDDGRGRIFLVRKRGTTAFMQAGGKIEPGEAPLDALARELAEELDFASAGNEARFLGTFSSEAANEPDHRLEAHLFHIRVGDRALRPAAELEEGLWVSPDAAARLPLAPFTRDHVLPLARALAS
jgi:8-oxo-dGTP diphosphatase